MTEVDALLLEKLEEINKRLIRIEQTKQTHQEWLTKDEAKMMLDCGDTKLKTLVKDSQILVNNNPCKGKQLRYSLKSINKYLSGQ